MGVGFNVLGYNEISIVFTPKIWYHNNAEHSWFRKFPPPVLAIVWGSQIWEVQPVLDITDLKLASKKGQGATMQIETWLNKIGYTVNQTKSQLPEKCNSKNGYTDEVCTVTISSHNNDAVRYHVLSKSSRNDQMKTTVTQHCKQP